MPINITWDQPHPSSSTHYNFPPEPAVTQTTPRKLKKRVSFANSVKSTTSGKTDYTDISESHTTPESPRNSDGEKKGWKTWSRSKGKEKEVDMGPERPISPSSPSAKSGWLSRFDSWKSTKTRPFPLPIPQSHPGNHIEPPMTHAMAPAAHTEPSPTWHHHDRYFPAFSDTDIAGLTPDPKPTPPLHTFTSPFENALTPMEMQAKEHSTLVGRNVVIHYPDLPAFKDYLQGKTPEAIGWQTSKWGTEGWTGYGWGGEVLPDKDGKSFGAAMPVGKLPPPPEGGKKKEKGEGGEGGEEKEGGGEKNGEAAAGGDAGGGGGKKGKKKK